MAPKLARQESTGDRGKVREFDFFEQIAARQSYIRRLRNAIWDAQDGDPRARLFVIGCTAQERREAEELLD